MEPARRFCNKCGTELRTSSRFCPKCGAPVAMQPPQAPAPQPPPAPSYPAGMPPVPPSRPAPGPAPSYKPSTPPSKRRNLGLIIGAVVLALLALACCLAVGGYYGYKEYWPTLSTSLATTPKGTVSITPVLTGTAHTPTITVAPIVTPTLTPTLTPGPTNTSIPSASYGNVSFTYSPALASSVTGKTVPAAMDPDFPARSRPEMTVFDFVGYPVESSILPTVQVFLVESYRSLSNEAAAEITELQTVLRDRPPAPTSLPLMPLQPVASLITVQVGYLDFQTGSGVRYLTQMVGGAVSPVRNGALFYTYQGITSDNRYYVSVTMPVFSPILANPPAPASLEGNYQAYLDDIIRQLNSQPLSSFTPDLNLLDAMARSITVR